MLSLQVKHKQSINDQGQIFKEGFVETIAKPKSDPLAFHRSVQVLNFCKRFEHFGKISIYY